MSASPPTEETSARQRTRNAQAQADLRARRKQYIKSLEDTVASLESCVRQLRQHNGDLQRKVDKSASMQPGPSSPAAQTELVENLARENSRLHRLLAEVGLAAASSAKLARMGKDYGQPGVNGGDHYVDAAEAARLTRIIEAGLAAGSQAPPSQPSLPRWTDTQSIQAKHRRVSEAQAFASETRMELGLPANHNYSPDVRRSLDRHSPFGTPDASPYITSSKKHVATDGSSNSVQVGLQHGAASGFDNSFVFLQGQGQTGASSWDAVSNFATPLASSTRAPSDCSAVSPSSLAPSLSSMSATAEASPLVQRDVDLTNWSTAYGPLASPPPSHNPLKRGSQSEYLAQHEQQQQGARPRQRPRTDTSTPPVQGVQQASPYSQTLPASFQPALLEHSVLQPPRADYAATVSPSLDGSHSDSDWSLWAGQAKNNANGDRAAALPYPASGDGLAPTGGPMALYPSTSSYQFPLPSARMRPRYQSMVAF
ncbi:hypothetical protein ACQY0O_000303 [Thecaphora frezii]